MASNIMIQVVDNRAYASQAIDSALDTALEKVGLNLEGYAKLNLSTPKLHANGVVKPNVDTGRLRNSITHAVDTSNKTLYVGTNVEYAAYVELGTSRMRSYAYLKPAIADNIDNIKATLVAYLSNL